MSFFAHSFLFVSTLNLTSMPEFTGSEPRSLSLEIFLDETDKGGDVSKDVDTLFACLVPLDTTLSAQKPSPPFVQFGWGTTVLFTAFLKSVNAKYTLFRPTGAPVRAACTISLEEIPSEAGKQNPTSGSLTALRSHTVIDPINTQHVERAPYIVGSTLLAGVCDSP